MILTFAREIVSRLSPIPLPFLTPVTPTAPETPIIAIDTEKNITSLMRPGNSVAVEKGLAITTVECITFAIANQDGVEIDGHFMLTLRISDIGDHETFSLKIAQLIEFIEQKIAESFGASHQTFVEQFNRGQMIRIDTQPPREDYPPE